MRGLSLAGERGGRGEADLSAESTATQEDPWVSRADVDEGRAKGAQASTGQGTSTAHGLSNGVPTDRAARLPRTARLRGDTEFRELFQWGQRIERESFVM